MTREQKVKAYDEALERARKIHKYSSDLAEIKRMEHIFPELAESEDEKIRKALIDGFTVMKESKNCGKTFSNHNIPVADILAWLERQGEPNQHLELKAGNWYICHRAYCCRADHLTVKEGERFQCEKDGIVKGFVVKEPEKYFKECSAPATTECNYIGSDDVRRRSTIQVLEYARSLDAYNQYGKADIDKNISWLEKQGNQREELINKACDVLVNCIEDYMLRRMEVWGEECKNQTLENIRKKLEE